MSSSSSIMPALGQPLPSSPDFPVTWAEARHARQLWTLDRMHFGTLTLPLVADVYRRQVASGFNRTAVRYALPVHLEFLYINGYLYNANPLVDAPPEFVQKALYQVGRVAPGIFNAVQGQVVKGMTAKYMANLAPVMASLDRYWTQEWRPELQEQLAFWRNFDLAAAALPALLAHLDESLQRIERLWVLHFGILVPACLALSQFVDEYRAPLERHAAQQGDSLTIFALLQGVDHSFLQADQALWQLSRQARILPAVRQTLEQQPAHAVMAQLAQHTEGQIFLAELRAWLEKYGQRGLRADGLSSASLLDDPTPVIHNLQESLAVADQDLVTEIHAQAADRAQRIAQARRQLQNQLGRAADEELARFDRQLVAAQCGEFLLTEHNFWIDQQAMYRLRLVLLELGRRGLGMGLWDAPSDIFYLTQDELVASLPTAGTPAGTPPRHALIAARKAELDHFHTLTPPDAIGTMPWMVPPDEPFVRAMTRLFGVPLVPTAAVRHATTWGAAMTVVRGQAAAPGKVRGTARVIHTLEEAERLQRGDILVTTATMPPWTPLLAIAGGVVTDVGGILSHAAIIAREYRIPAVVATRVATATIQDGQLIEVDGGAGVVTILADAA